MSSERLNQSLKNGLEIKRVNNINISSNNLTQILVNVLYSDMNEKN